MSSIKEGTRASGSPPGPGIAAPRIGAPPGGRSLESFSPRAPSSIRAESFRTVRPHTTLKLENKLAPKPKQENKFKSFQTVEPKRLAELPKNRNSFESVKPITKEIKPPEKTLAKPRGSQRFAQLGNTREYRINRSVDPLDRNVSKNEINGMQKVVEAPKVASRKIESQNRFLQALSKTPEQSQNKTKVPDIFQKAFDQKPESFLNPNIERKQLNQLPKGKERFIKSAELLAKLNNEKAKTPEITKRTNFIDALKNQKVGLAEAATKTRRETFASLLKDQKVSVAEAVAKSPQSQTRTELIKSLLGNKSASLSEITKKDIPEIAATPVTEIKAQTKRDLITDLLKDKSTNLHEVFEKSVELKQIPEIIAKTPLQTRRELMKNLLKEQKVSLAEILESKLKTEIKSQIPDTEFQKDIKQKIAAGNEQSPITITKLAEKVVDLKQSNSKNEIQTTISLKTVEQNLEVVKQILAEKNQNQEQSITPAVLNELIKQPNIIDFQKAKELIETKKQPQSELIQPEIKNPAQVEATIQLLQQPELININPEKRVEAIKLLQEVSDTKEYAADPKLQEQIKIVVKKEQERIIEEAEIVKTAGLLIEAGAEPEIVTERLQAVIERKQLPISNEQLEMLIQKAQIKESQQFPQLIAENGEIIEENEDEYQQMIRKLQLFLIELDEKTLEKRFEAVFRALEKTWIEAHEEGWEKVDGTQIVANLPGEEPIEQKSQIVRPLNQTDGSLVEATKDIQRMGSFDDLDQIRQTLSNILLNHLPGKASNQPTTQQLSDQQVKEIFRGGMYPSQMGNGKITYAQFQSTNISTIAA